MPKVDHSMARTAKLGKDKRGDRTIEVSIRFWTDKITTKGAVIQKHAWDSGTITMKRNSLHCIRPKTSKPFNSILDLPSVLAKVLEEHEIALHPSSKTRKVVKP